MAGTEQPGPETEDPADSPVRQLAEDHLADAGAAWAVGTGTGAVEFARSPDEHVTRGPNSAVTIRGAIRLSIPDRTVAIAYETPDDSDPLRWHHAVAFCLPAADAHRAGRTVVTELGPDDDVLRPQDTGGVLFDLGSGGPDAELLVRTSDPAALAVLRATAGRTLGDADEELTDVLAGPVLQRVVRTVAARIEVYGPPRRRPLPAHPPTAPIPHDWLPCLTLRPAHPAANRAGHPRPFDRERHRAFQALLVTHGDPVLGVVKADVVTAVRAGRGPEDALVTDDPVARAAVAVAIRQLAFTDGTSGALAAWRSRFGTG
jgi:hypothetical protein